MMNRQLIIRVDASPSIGYGHAMRCLSLAMMLRRYYNIIFMSKTLDGSIVSIVKAYGFSLTFLESDSEFHRQLGPNVCVILDGYEFSSDFQREIKSTQAMLVCIDDLHDRFFWADIVVNSAPGVSPQVYAHADYTQFLLGPEYSLLRPKFNEVARRPRSIGQLKNVLVCFGGADPLDLTGRAVKILKQVRHIQGATIVTGGGYRFADRLVGIIGSDTEKLHWKSNLSEDELIANLLAVELAIVPASGILFETIACKTPAISGYYTNNQMDIYKGFKGMNAFIDARDFGEAALLDALVDLNDSDLTEVSSNISGLIDGHAEDRYVRSLASLMMSRPI